MHNEQSGIVCNRCGLLSYYWIEAERRWRFNVCDKAIGLKTGTIMEHSNSGYKVWL
ncbi:MAG TPA: hypothetical protein VFQ86_08730 [Arachidicoccus soli]|nr:hypothetical protein [Arachidicoccus soli]